MVLEFIIWKIACFVHRPNRDDTVVFCLLCHVYVRLYDTVCHSLLGNIRAGVFSLCIRIVARSCCEMSGLYEDVVKPLCLLGTRSKRQS